MQGSQKKGLGKEVRDGWIGELGIEGGVGMGMGMGMMRIRWKWGIGELGEEGGKP
jgi:hypothetical protein